VTPVLIFVFQSETWIKNNILRRTEAGEIKFSRSITWCTRL